MISHRRRRATALALSTATVALTCSTLVAPADAAAGRHFGDVATYYKATIESCKVSTDGGEKWRVYLRLDNTDNRRRDERSLSAFVLRNGEPTNRRVDTPYIPGGRVSAVKSLVVPKGAQYTLGMGVAAGQMGQGGDVAPADLRRC